MRRWARCLAWLSLPWRQNMSKEIADQAVFNSTRDLVLGLQRAEERLTQCLKTICEDKKVYLEKLQEVCKHDCITQISYVSCKDLRITSFYPMDHHYNVRVCQICGLRDAVLVTDEYPVFHVLTDDHVKRAKVNFTGDCHWTTEGHLLLNLKLL